MLMNFADLSEEQKHSTTKPIEELFSIKQEVDDPILNEQDEQDSVGNIVKIFIV